METEPLNVQFCKLDGLKDPHKVALIASLPLILLFSEVKGCDPNFEVKCSNFKICYKRNNCLGLDNIY